MPDENKKILDESTKVANQAANLIGGTFTQGVGFQPITSASLASFPEPYKLTTPQGTSANSDLNAILATSASQTKADALAQQTQETRDAAQKATDTSRESLYNAFLQKIGIQESKAKVQEEFGIAGKTQKVTDYTNQLESLEKAQLDEIRGLDNQPGTLAQKQQRISDISYRYNQRKADVAILQSAANRDLATASALAEAKINTQLEPLNTRIEFLTNFYNDNKDQLSKADQNAFNVALQDAQAERTQRASELKTLSDTKLEILKNIYAYAPPEVAAQLAKNVQAATSVDQVISAGGQFGGDILERKIKEAQYAELLSKARERDAVSSTGKPLTAAQQSSISYANRVFDSNQVINEIGGQFTGIGSYLGQFAPNTLKSDDRQRYEQAQRNFINAVLRRESGAAISVDEFKNAKLQYFPQPGDGEPVIQQKRLNRERTLENLLREGGQTIEVIQSAKDPLGLGVGTNPLGI